MLGSQELFLNSNGESFQMSGPMVSIRKSCEAKKKCSLKRKDAAAAVTKGFQIEESISTKFPLRPDVSARKLSWSIFLFILNSFIQLLVLNSLRKKVIEIVLVDIRLQCILRTTSHS